MNIPIHPLTIIVALCVFVLSTSTCPSPKEQPDIEYYIYEEEQVDHLFHYVKSHQGKIYGWSTNNKPLRVWWLTDKNSRRIAQVTYDMCSKYRLNPTLILNQAWKESNMKWFVKNNTKAGIRQDIQGIMQVSLKYFDKELYFVQNKRWAKELLELPDPLPRYRQLARRIDVGIELGCRIMSNHFHNYQNYELALIAYWQGPYSTVFSNAKKDGAYAKQLHYVKDILR